MARAWSQYWPLIDSYLRPQWWRVVVLAVLLLADTGLTLLNPQIMRVFVDMVASSAALDTLLTTALLFLGVALANQGVAVLVTLVSQRVAWAATNALRLDLTLHCLKLGQSFYETHTPGELTERIDGDVGHLASFLSQFMLGIIGNAVLLIGILGLLFREDWRIGLVLSLFVLSALVIFYQVRAVGVPYWSAMRQMSASFFGFLGELLGGSEDICANGAQGYAMRRFYEFRQQWLDAKLRGILRGHTLWIANVSIFALGYVVVCLLGTFLWRAQAITIGTIYLVLRYTELLRDPITRSQDHLRELQEAGVSISRIQGLLATQSQPPTGSATLPQGALSVECQNVSFGYNHQEHVLRGVTFHLARGRVLGLLGRTGSGKTTLVRLLLRIYDPSEGEIRLGGTLLSETGLSEVRRRISMVTQDVQLFQATVRDNVTFFNPDIADQYIESVLRELGLGEWLCSLPDGLDTELAAGGSGLSAGQGQLLALARAFLTEPSLVILDEASSRLDPATERLIERAVDKLLQDRTAIVIAHHLATVQRADEILILEDGQVLEQGDRAKLIQDPQSCLSRLLRTGFPEVSA